MVNVGLNWSSVLGVTLAASGLALYFLRSMRPKLARDHDIFFAAVALLCGGILFFQGWRQDPILQFGQFLLTGSAVFFAVESVRLRGLATEQARRTAPIVDEDRPVSRMYRAELDDLETLDDRATTRRIRGTRDSRPNRDEYEEDVRRRPSSRSSSEERSSAGNSDRPRRRPSRPISEPVDAPESFYDDETMPDSRRRTRNNGAPRPSNPPSEAVRPRRSRPTDQESPRRPRNEEPVAPPSEYSEYVDYRPVENNDESDNWSNE
ncbi:Ycf66 family protein [Phormidium sp. CLA17]|uniref:Ycf66 family protein n=1 Tax=Leptolyngbya sp. Cla-17 TaxID=2803751 RepID=UPI001491D3DA|nr:Ycf66 family protein [Leptolyngbya sp. Cla-17]MBM0743248.1 Ycf66 family protein [Leptolyngbya sp. Cla-17]